MFKAVVIGCSAGGLGALKKILDGLPETYPVPIIVIQHRSSDQTELLEEVLRYKCRIAIRQANEKEKLRSGFVYIAPPAYHLLIESDETFSLTSDMRVRHSMPSIDVTFESAAEVFGPKIVGIIMTGASNDGSDGIKAIKKSGGITIAQDPGEAQFPFMPQSAISTRHVDFILSTDAIGKFLKNLYLPSNEKG